MVNIPHFSLILPFLWIMWSGIGGLSDDEQPGLKDPISRFGKKYLLEVDLAAEIKVVKVYQGKRSGGNKPPTNA